MTPEYAERLTTGFVVSGGALASGFRSDTEAMPNSRMPNAWTPSTQPGTYQLVFDVGAYFRAQGFLDLVPIRFAITDAAAHWCMSVRMRPNVGTASWRCECRRCRCSAGAT